MRFYIGAAVDESNSKIFRRKVSDYNTYLETVIQNYNCRSRETCFLSGDTSHNRLISIRPDSLNPHYILVWKSRSKKLNRRSLTRWGREILKSDSRKVFAQRIKGVNKSRLGGKNGGVWERAVKFIDFHNVQKFFFYNMKDRAYFFPAQYFSFYYCRGFVVGAFEIYGYSRFFAFFLHFRRGTQMSNRI